MSLEDLEQAGVLLPRDQWGKHQLHTTVNKPWLIALGVVAALAVMLMYWGNGHVSTWIGVGLFFIALCGFTWLSLRAIEQQHQKSEKV